jgi:hypothetical protein
MPGQARTKQTMSCARGSQPGGVAGKGHLLLSLNPLQIEKHLRAGQWRKVSKHPCAAAPAARRGRGAVGGTGPPIRQIDQETRVAAGSSRQQPRAAQPGCPDASPYFCSLARCMTPVRVCLSCADCSHGRAAGGWACDASGVSLPTRRISRKGQSSAEKASDKLVRVTS